MPELINLVCPVCGGKIETIKNSDQMLCSYCGNKFQVYQNGNDMSVTNIEKTIQAAQSGMDRMASELAIKRIQSELVDLNNKMQPHSADWEKLKALKNDVPNFNLTKKITLWTILGSFIIFFISTIMNLPVIGMISLLVFLAGLVFLIYIGIKAGSKKIEKRQTDKEFNKMSVFMIPLEEQINKKNQELQKHQQIVNEKFN